MKTTLILLFTLFSAALTQAETFRLKNIATEKITGPYTQGDVIILGTNRYVVMSATPSVSIKKQLERIILPEVNFRQVDLRDVVTFLRDASAKYDPEKLGVNFILMPIKHKASKGGVAVRSPKYPKVTMNIKNVSLKDVLSLIQSATGVSMRIQHNAVVIRPPEPIQR